MTRLRECRENARLSQKYVAIFLGVAALRSGIEVKTVQNNLGHKDATVTLNTYAKYTEDMGRAGAEKFAAYWAENTKV